MLLMKLLQIVWDKDTEKFSALFSPNLNAAQVAPVCVPFQQEAMDTLVELEMMVKSFNSEEEKSNTAKDAQQSTRWKPFVKRSCESFCFLL
jgi:hypothetical protein